MVQGPITQGYVVSLRAYAATNKEQKFMKQKLEKLG